MSDLAPFVAATISDKVIADLNQENKRLREQFETTRTVEVTGLNGSPQCASGNFAKGNYLGPRVWKVSLSNEPPQKKPISFSALKNMEVHVGGVLYAARPDGVEIRMDYNELDGENQKVLHCHFGNLERKVSVRILIQGWPRISWLPLQQNDIEYHSRTIIGGPEHGFGEDNQFFGRIEKLYPNATVKFLAIHFNQSGVKKAIDNLNIDSSLLEQTRASQLEAYNKLSSDLAAWMREPMVEAIGHEYIGHELERQSLNQFLDVMQILGIASEEDVNYEDVVDRLVRDLLERVHDVIGDEDTHMDEEAEYTFRPEEYEEFLDPI